MTPEAEHAAELIRIASEAGAKQANQRLEKAIDDLHRAAEIIETLVDYLDHMVEDADDLLKAMDDGGQFAQHIRTEWDR